MLKSSSWPRMLAASLTFVTVLGTAAWAQQPPTVRIRLGIEAGSAFGWQRYTTDSGAMLAMEGFGASAPGDRLFQEFKFTPERAAEMVRTLLARRQPA